MTSKQVDGTRPRILSLLKERGYASVEELAQEMALASTSIRRHLDILQRDRFVDLRQSREHTGRPQNQYFLTEEGLEAQPKGYGHLLVLLLAEMSNLTPEDTANLDGQSLTKLLFGRMAARVTARTDHLDRNDHPSRLAVLLDWLTEGDFKPQAKQEEDAILITLHNCPFRLGALADHNVCHFDQAIVSGILGIPVTQEKCIRKGDRSCCYLAPVASEAKA